MSDEHTIEVYVKQQGEAQEKEENASNKDIDQGSSALRVEHYHNNSLEPFRYTEALGIVKDTTHAWILFYLRIYHVVACLENGYWSHDYTWSMEGAPSPCLSDHLREQSDSLVLHLLTEDVTPQHGIPEFMEEQEALGLGNFGPLIELVNIKRRYSENTLHDLPREFIISLAEHIMHCKARVYDDWINVGENKV